MTAKDEQISAGFVAVLGAPNAGKSTLVNRAVGAKVSIVSPKVQTTRTIDECRFACVRRAEYGDKACADLLIFGGHFSSLLIIFKRASAAACSAARLLLPCPLNTGCFSTVTSTLKTG